MRFNGAYPVAWGAAAVGLVGLLLFVGLSTRADIAVTSLFYRPGDGFFLANAPGFLAAHWLATIGSRILAGALVVGTTIAATSHKPFLGLPARSWLFVLVGLILIPGVIVNLGFKDHWGRARPHEVTNFGGIAPITPALEPQIVRHGNGSFVAGDPSFAFFLTAFAYVVPYRLSRRVFWGCILLGIGAGVTRLAMGSHFLSDIMYGGVLVLGLLTALHAQFFNTQLTLGRWRLWFFAKA